MAARLLLFDCDSTLSAIEGIDELGRLRDPEVFREVEEMTTAAMEGGTPMEAIFARRLDMIRPTKSELEAIGRQYIDTVEPNALATINALKNAGWRIAIVSGGFTQAILPLADFLGIDRVEAVELKFHHDGSYAGFNEACPTSRTKGKNVVARQLREETNADLVILVGDGASDLEVKGDADIVIGFGRYAVRPKVKAGADAFIMSLAELPELVAAMERSDMAEERSTK
jgi:phosphoserine phosphatase